MQNKSQDTALMVFSLSARKETSRKMLFGQGQNSVAQHFFDLLIKQTTDISFSSGIDVIWVDEKKQRGSSFGERYANAFTDAFNQGYEKVISIGNDCPDLTLAILYTAINQLNTKKLILGPATDGGIYLVGLHRDGFNPEEFKELPWLTDSLFNKLVLNASIKGLDYYCLNTLSDIDDVKDLKEFAFRNTDTILSGLILQYFSKKVKVFKCASRDVKSLFHKEEFLLRGPPLFA